MINFYQNTLGFELLRRTDFNAYLYLGDQLLELSQAKEKKPVTIPKTSKETMNYMFKKVGINHLGIRVDDLDEAIKKIEDAGAVVIRPIEKFEPHIDFVKEVSNEKLRRASQPINRKFWRICGFFDPDGNYIELLER